jgi:hypothetical protein
MSGHDVEGLRGAYRDFNAGKPETVLALADENVEWIPVSVLMEGNRYH